MPFIHPVPCTASQLSRIDGCIVTPIYTRYHSVSTDKPIPREETRGFRSGLREDIKVKLAGCDGDLD